MREWVSLNGELMPAEEAHVSVFDSGFTQGIGLFSTMRGYQRKVFRLDRHLERLHASAGTLGWSVLPQIDQMRENVLQVVSATPGDTLRVRITVTTGALRDWDGEEPQLTYVATAAPGGEYPDKYYQDGVTVALSRFRQSTGDPTVGHKTTSFFARLAALREAVAKTAVEALWFTDENYLAEGSISSVFVIKDAVALTPPLDTPILPGITRSAVIEAAASAKIALREERLTLEDVLGADEIFLTNSMMGVMPVVRIEGEAVGRGKPGPFTRSLAEAYINLFVRECEGG